MITRLLLSIVDSIWFANFYLICITTTLVLIIYAIRGVGQRHLFLVQLVVPILARMFYAYLLAFLFILGVLLSSIVCIHKLKPDESLRKALPFYITVFASMVSTSPFSALILRFMRKRAVQDRKNAARLLSTCFLGSFILLLIFFFGIAVLQTYTGFLVVADSSYSVTLVIIALLTSYYMLREIILAISGSEQNARETLTFTIAYGLSSAVVACLAALITHDYRVVLIGLTVGYSIGSVA